MIAILLANWRAVVTAILIILPCTYAAVQKMRFEHTRAAFAQYRAEVAAAAAEAEVRNAQAAAAHEKNTREALDDLQARYDAISARYASVRRPASPSSGSVPTTPGAAPTPSACPPGQPDATARCLATLEIGDKELAKYRELWNLGRKNAVRP